MQLHRYATVAALAACLFPSCRKDDKPADVSTAGQADAAPDAPPPPPPPPPLRELAIELDGWKLEVGVPEGFVQDETDKGTFRPAGSDGDASSFSIATAGAADCGPGAWLGCAEKIVFEAVSGYDIEDPVSGRITKARVLANRKVSTGRYEFEVTTPEGGEILGEPFIAGGVYEFNDAWPEYLVCSWAAALETAPTFRPALADACASVKVLEAPAAGVAPPTPPVPDDRPPPEADRAPEDAPAADASPADAPEAPEAS